MKQNHCCYKRIGTSTPSVTDWAFRARQLSRHFLERKRTSHPPHSERIGSGMPIFEIRKFPYDLNKRLPVNTDLLCTIKLNRSWKQRKYGLLQAPRKVWGLRW